MECKTVVDGWLKRVKEFDRDYLAIKELANIIGASYSKVKYDIERRNLKATKMGSFDSKAEYRIYKPEAIDYIESFCVD